MRKGRGKECGLGCGPSAVAAQEGEGGKRRVGLQLRAKEREREEFKPMNYFSFRIPFLIFRK
jgi:hypothetical protein